MSRRERIDMDFRGENLKGVVLAMISSGFIGASFIVKKKGLRRAAAASGVRAGVGGHSYLWEPLWWLGMTTMIVGEVANFVAYAFAPAIIVTPLGSLSIIVSTVLAHFLLKEKLHKLGMLGCLLCITGSVVIVIHAPQEHPVDSVLQIWRMAIQPAFLFYVGFVLVLVLILVFHYAPKCGHTNVLVFTGICSLMGSLSVMSVKALGISLKLTFEGTNQLVYPETWIFMFVVASCVIVQMNYLNKALDTFNTAVVSPIYYVLFTTLTILASVIMFKDWDNQNAGSIISEICGLVVVLSGSIMLHTTKDFERSSKDFERNSSFIGSYAPLSPTLSSRLCGGGGEFKHDEEEEVASFEEAYLKRQEQY